MADNQKKTTKITSKQIVAWIGIVLLLLLYVALLLTALFDKSSSGRLFWMCLYATIAVPILVWIYAWLYGKIKESRKDTTDDEE